MFAVSGTVIGTIGGALIGSKGAKDAAKTSAEASDRSVEENARQFDIAQANQKPYLEAGKAALGTLASENDRALDTSNLQMEPGYQFGLDQGQQAINRQTAAAGGRISGAALKAAAQYGTDYATSGYSAAYNRANQARTDRLNRLATLAGIGQISTQNINSNGAAVARENAGIRADAANTAGAASLAQGNIWGNAGNQLAALYGRNSGAGFTQGASNGITEGAKNQTANFNEYGWNYSP